MAKDNMSPLSPPPDATIKMKNEINKLMETVSNQGKELQLIKEIQDHVGKDKPQSEIQLRDIWNQVFRQLIEITFKNGASYYNTKPKLLQSELQLCILRADEAVAAYIAVRNVSPDPVRLAQERWNREAFEQL